MLKYSTIKKNLVRNEAKENITKKKNHSKVHHYYIRVKIIT